MLSESRREPATVEATVEATISVGEDAFFSAGVAIAATGVSAGISVPLSTVVDKEDEFGPEAPLLPLLPMFGG